MPRSISKVEEAEATSLAMEGLAGLAWKPSIVKLLMTNFVIKKTVAQKIVRKAEALMVDEINSSTQGKRARHRKILEHLYRVAMKSKKLSVCANVAQQLGKMDNLEAPQHVVHTAAPKDDDFDNRSVEELDHYLEHGCFAEELGNPEKKTNVENDPLQGLH